MAITAIRLVRNTANIDAYIRNHEHPDDTPGPNGQRLVPGAEFRQEMWVPWADNEQQYLNGSGGGGPAHISITVGDEEFNIWQIGDAVCYSVNVGYIADGRSPVPGKHDVGGRRDVHIVRDAENVSWDILFLGSSE